MLNQVRGGGYDDTHKQIISTLKDVEYYTIDYNDEQIKVPILITTHVDEPELEFDKSKLELYKNGFSVECHTFVAFLKDKDYDEMLLAIIIAKPDPIRTDEFILHMRENSSSFKSNEYYHISLIFDYEIARPSLKKCCYCDSYEECKTENDYSDAYLNSYIIKLFQRYNNKPQTIRVERIDNSIAVLDYSDGIGNDHMVHIVHSHSRYYNRELHISL